MSYFVISGNPRCACFGHALHVARYLNEKLPNFQYKKVEKLDSEWADHVLELNRENKWFIHKSPVIWKEINMWGGKKYLIGGISEFWEYVYCYYGLESLISKEETAKLAADNLKFFLEQHHADAERLNYVQNISILGACNPQTPILLHDLIELDEIKKISGVTFKLHDSLGHIEHKAMFMQECADLVNERCIYGHPDTVTVVCDEEDAIKYADIIIHVEDFSRALTAPPGSTLPLGIMKTELRQMSYMLPKDDSIAEEVERRKLKMKVRLERPPVLAKVRAVTSLLKLWYSKEQAKGVIISLGVCSNGSFEIPSGLVFSQPVKLDDTEKWIPFGKFPLLNDFTKTQIKICSESATHIMKKFHINPVIDDLDLEGGSMYTQYSVNETL
ncbi:putative malate dehydrogenase 1B isoform X3 [Leptinotarsa decemlineata]|uniref:putative malate dehydrogenase 1B isoform X3 n=1 Tax=Leptinotarsa decemlineata TaxID=7539 RepID=UPI003D30592E